MASSTFSRPTNDRDYRAVVRLFFELLHSTSSTTSMASNATGSIGLNERLWLPMR